MKNLYRNDDMVVPEEKKRQWTCWNVPAFLAAFAATVIATNAAADPAQYPLLGRLTNPAHPNVVYTLDDSGSMAWRYMPDKIAPLSGNERWMVTFHHEDSKSQNKSITSGTLKLIGTGSDLLSARMRSSSYNTLYYNPDIQYKRWLKSDGTEFRSPDPRSAWVNPNDESWGKADLTITELPKNQYNGHVCTSSGCNSSWNSNKNFPFAPATYYKYVGRPDNDNDIKDANKYQRVQIVASGTYIRSAARKDCSPIPDSEDRQCTGEQELLNFANWFVYNRTRLYLAITASTQAFAPRGEELRVGYGRIGLEDATVDGRKTDTLQRGVRKFAHGSDDRADFFEFLHKAPAASATPLRRAMDDIGKYYSWADNRGPWGDNPGTNVTGPHLACRKSYHILMTDGYWNGDQAPTSDARDNVDGKNSTTTILNPAGGSYQYRAEKPYKDSAKNTLADVAMYYWNRDLRPDLANKVKPDTENPAFWQHMVNFTVGLGVDGTLKFPDALLGLQAGTTEWPATVAADSPATIDDLWHAAVNSRGRYLSATDATTFTDELSKILNEIASRNASEAGIAIANRVLQVGNLKFLPSYTTIEWTGDVTAIALDATGQQLAPLWSAAAGIPQHSNRKIFVGTRGPDKAVPFTWNAMSKTLQDELGKADLVGYLRGDASMEGGGYRKRSKKLGDIVNSQPVYVHDLVNLRYNLLPKGTAGASSYTAFLADKKARQGMLFVGANDGMLHAFGGSDGVETFAFIPRSLLPKLKALAQPTYEHQYYVDGPLTESDAFWDTKWRNVLVGSTGAGSRAVFALDVTDTTTMGAGNVLWEVDSTVQSELGHVLAPIEVGLMKNGDWAAIFGNGFASASGKAQLYVLNLKTGALIKKIDTGAGSGNGLGGVQLIRDGNQVVVGAFAGDLKGNVWKFDLSSKSESSWSTSFSGSPLFNTGQAITAAPNLVAHPRGGNVVLVGTGRLFEDGDQLTVSQQSLYGLWDKQTLVGSVDPADSNAKIWKWSVEGPITVASSVKARAMNTATVIGFGDETFYTTANTAAINWDTDRGWKLPLTIMGGQRLIVSPQLLLGMALFETISPFDGSTAGDPCMGTEGQGVSLLLDPLSGVMSAKPLIDINGDGVVDVKDPPVAGWASGKWGGSSSWLSEATPVAAKECTPGGIACLCPAGTKQMRGIGADAGSMPVCFSIPPPTRWWWRQLNVQ